jgi:hypothetical protein
MMFFQRANLLSLFTILTFFLFSFEGVNAVEQSASSVEPVDRDVTDSIALEDSPQQRRELFWSLVFLST